MLFKIVGEKGCKGVLSQSNIAFFHVNAGFEMYCNNMSIFSE